MSLVVADPSPTRYRLLAVLLLAALLVRLALFGWFAGREPAIFDEKHLYHKLAVSLHDRGVFGIDNGPPLSNRPPLMPAFIAGLYAWFGVGDYDAVRIAQLILSLASMVLVYQLGKATYSESVGLWAAALYGFYPSLLVYNNLLLAESLFIFLMLLGLYWLAVYLERGGLLWAALGGALLALAALTRSVLWLYPPVLALVVIVSGGGAVPLSRRMAAAAVACLTFAAVLTPWAVRNTQLQKTLTVVDATGGRNFMMGNYEYTPWDRPWMAINEPDGRTWSDVVASRHPEFFSLSDGQRDKLAMHEALVYIQDHPGETAWHDIGKFFDFWQLERELAAQAAQGYFGLLPTSALWAGLVLVAGAYAATLALGVFGLCLATPRNRGTSLLLLSIVALVAALHTLSFGHSRYHVPVMPLICIYAGAALGAVNWSGATRRPAFWLATAVVLVLAASWVYEAVVVDRERILLFIS
jgi:4-amino-4-deoxy-L-arabinose transferase-like glycosyltransferase